VHHGRVVDEARGNAKPAARRGTPAARRRRAADPATSARTLRRIGRSRRWDVRALVAGNPSCPATTRARLARDREWAVRAAVAACPAGDAMLLAALVDDVAPVRLELAGNPSCPRDVVLRLLDGADPWVAGLAAGHPAVPPDRLRALCTDLAAPPWALRLAAVNPACPQEQTDEVLTWLALGGAHGADPTFHPRTCFVPPEAPTATVPHRPWPQVEQERDPAAAPVHALWPVRRAAARPGIPRSVATALARDPHPRVRQAASWIASTRSRTLRELADDADPATAAAAARRISLRTGQPTHVRTRPRVVVTTVVAMVLVAGVGAVLGDDRSASRPEPVDLAELAELLGSPPDLGASTGSTAPLDLRPFAVRAHVGEVAGRPTVTLVVEGMRALRPAELDVTGIRPDRTYDHIPLPEPTQVIEASGATVFHLDDAGWVELHISSSADGRLLAETVVLER
jgi:hypothetical protein